MNSFKTEVCCSGSWSANALRYATAAEAEAAGRELLSRWYVPTDSRAVPSADPVNRVLNLVTNRNEPLPELQPA